MEKHQVIDLLKFIRGSYSRFEINEEMPRVWHEMLSEEDYEEVVSRLRKHIRNSRYEPTLMDLVTSDAEQNAQRMKSIEEPVYEPKVVI